MLTKRKYNVSTVLFAFLIVSPVLVGLSRDYFINRSISNKNIHLVTPMVVSEKTCLLDICKQTYDFILPETIRENNDYPAIGYYSAFADSFITVNGADLGRVSAKSDVIISWFQFHTHTLTSLSRGDARITVNCISPMGTNKLGMDNPNLLFGNKRDIDAIASLFSFFSIHIYLLSAFFVSALGAGLLLTESVRKSMGERRLIAQTLVSVFALFLYSHYFDVSLINIGIPKHIVEIATRLWFGPILAAFFILKNRTAVVASIAYVLFYVPALLNIPFGNEMALYGNRWIFTIITLAFCFALIRRKLPLYYSPFALLLTKDAATVQGLIPLTSGVYLWILGIPGVFLLANVRHLKQIIDDQVFIMRTKEVARIFDRMKQTGQTTVEDWQILLKRFCSSLSQATDAKRISVCYLLAERPIILSFNNGIFKPINDGKLPNKFARVIQTKSPLWFVNKKTLERLAPATPGGTQIEYRTDFACLIPIVSGGEVFGAISLTDFENESVRNNAEQQEEMKIIISRYVDHLSQLLMKKSKDNTIQRQHRSGEIITLFSRRILVSGDQKSIVTAFLDSIDNCFPCQALYFSYDSTDSRMRLLSGKNIAPEILALWAAVPFRAAKENLHAPFPIAINDRIPVYVGDITTLDRVLLTQSVELFKKTQTRTLFAAPIVFGDRVFGLVCLLDRTPHNQNLREAEYILDAPMKYLSLMLFQTENKTRLLNQEQVESDKDAKNISNKANNQMHALLLAQCERTVVNSIPSESVGGSVDAVSKYYDRLLPAAEKARAYLQNNQKGEMTTVIPLTDNNKMLPLETCLSYLENVRSALNINDNDNSGDRLFWILDRGEVLKKSQNNADYEFCGPDISTLLDTGEDMSLIAEICMAVTSRFYFQIRPEFQQLIKQTADLAFDGHADKHNIYVFKKSGLVKLVKQTKILNGRGLFSGTPGIQ